MVLANFHIAIFTPKMPIRVRLHSLTGLGAVLLRSSALYCVPGGTMCDGKYRAKAGDNE